MIEWEEDTRDFPEFSEIYDMVVDRMDTGYFIGRLRRRQYAQKPWVVCCLLDEDIHCATLDEAKLLAVSMYELES